MNKKSTVPKWLVYDWISSITVREGKKMVCRCTQSAQGKKYARMISALPEMLDFVEAFTTIEGQLVLMHADNGKEIYDNAVRICKKVRGEQ